ncbi:MAG: hypothetical protein SFT93_03090 [Rickettsiaceae bacterium]|nr:hypothetical protein [Rickettsiaceae bacterium]
MIKMIILPIIQELFFEFIADLALFIYLNTRSACFITKHQIQFWHYNKSRSENHVSNNGLYAFISLYLFIIILFITLTNSLIAHHSESDINSMLPMIRPKDQQVSEDLSVVRISFNKHLIKTKCLYDKSKNLCEDLKMTLNQILDSNDTDLFNERILIEIQSEMPDEQSEIFPLIYYLGKKVIKSEVIIDKHQLRKSIYIEVSRL